MAKKKTIDLSSLNISYDENNQTYKLQHFKKSNMTIDVAVYENGKFIKNTTIPFAHLPKSVKSSIKPL